MQTPIAATASITVAALPATTLAAALAIDPVSTVLTRGIIPGVRSVKGQTGPWSSPGQTRTLTLTDGSTVEETLVALHADGYRYRIAKFSGLFRFIVAEANARFDVAAHAGGSTLTWTYAFTPKGAMAAAILSFLVDSQWNGFMDAALSRLKPAIERA